MRTLFCSICVLGWSVCVAGDSGDSELKMSVFEELQHVIRGMPDESRVYQVYKNTGERMLSEVKSDRRYSVLFQLANNHFTSNEPFMLFGHYHDGGAPFLFSGILLTGKREVRIFRQGALEMMDSPVKILLDAQKLFAFCDEGFIYVPSEIAFDPPSVAFMMSFDGDHLSVNIFYDPAHALYTVRKSMSNGGVDVSTLRTVQYCFSAMLTRNSALPDVYRLVGVGVERGVVALMQDM